MKDTLKVAGVFVGIVGAYVLGKKQGFKNGVGSCMTILDTAISVQEVMKEKENSTEEVKEEES